MTLPAAPTLAAEALTMESERKAEKAYALTPAEIALKWEAAPREPLAFPLRP